VSFCTRNVSSSNDLIIPFLSWMVKSVRVMLRIRFASQIFVAASLRDVCVIGAPILPAATAPSLPEITLAAGAAVIANPVKASPPAAPCSYGVSVRPVATPVAVTSFAVHDWYAANPVR
jgi:hypothetical protein